MQKSDKYNHNIITFAVALSISGIVCPTEAPIYVGSQTTYFSPLTLI